MPPVAAAAAAIPIVDIIVTTLVSVAISVALSAVTAALFGKPKPPDLSGFQNRAQRRSQMLRSSIAPFETVYGEVVKSGTLVFAELAQNRTRLHMVIVLACHEVEEIGTIYLNDVPVTADDLDANNALVTPGHRYGPLPGVGDGPYFYAYKHLGASDQVASPELIAAFPAIWTSNHRLRGRAYIHCKLVWDPTTWSSGIPNIKAQVKGKQVLDVRDSTTKYTSNWALCVRDFLTLTDGLNAQTDELPDASWQDAANVAEERVDITAASDSFTLEDIDDDRLAFADPTKAPKFHAGDGVTISTDGQLPGNLTAGAYFFIRVHSNYFRLASSWENAIQGTAVSLTTSSPDASGTHTITLDDQVRYDLNGVYEDDQEVGNAIEEMMTAAAAPFTYPVGQFQTFPAAATTSSGTLTAADLRGPLRVRARPERRVLFNRVAGTFVDQDDVWQPTEFAEVTNSSYESQDNGEVLRREIELPWTTENIRAQRIGKIHLEKSRQGITVEMPCKLTVIGYRVWDTVSVTLDDFGWSAKKFRVIKWVLLKDGSGIDLTLQEEADTAYDWAEGDETAIDPAPDTGLSDAFSVEAPANLVLASGNTGLVIKQDGTVASRIKAMWDAISDPLVTTYGTIQIQAKQSADSTWDSVGSINAASTSIYIETVEDGASYDVRVRSISNLGIASEWTTKTNHVVQGKSAAPNKPDTFTVSRLADGTRRFEWTHASPAADVRVGGGYRIRYSTDTGAAWSAMTNLHSGLLLASPHETNQLAAGEYKFGIKTIDSSGNESADALFITLTIGDPRLEEVIFAQDEYGLGWPGTKTNCFVNHEGILEATGGTGSPSGDWASLPSTWSALADTWAAIVTNDSPFTYETDEIDLGAEYVFTPLLSTVATGAVTIQMKTGTAADGGVTGSYDTVTNVSGVQYIQFQIQVAGATPLLNRLDILLDGETVTELYDDVNTASATDVWFESVATGHFRIATKGDLAAISRAKIDAIQNTSAGYSWELLSKATELTASPSVLAAEFKIYDETGSLADATVDISLIGAKNA